VRLGALFLTVVSVCLGTGVAGATSEAFIIARSPVTALAADGDETAFAAAPTKLDCDRVFVWQRTPTRLLQLGRKQACTAPVSGPGIAGLAVTGGRALWVTVGGGKSRSWRLWTATTTKTTPRLLQSSLSPADDEQPIRVGAGGGGLLPYAVDSTVTTLRANGSTAFTWTAPARVVALAATNDRVAVAQEGARVTVLDTHGNVVSMDLYQTDVSAVAFTGKGILVQRGDLLELRREADAHEFVIAAGAQLDDADARWAAWSDGKLVHVIRLPDGAQQAAFPGSSAAFAGNRLFVANGRNITVRTIR
jgi:hypothetical protein